VRIGPASPDAGVELLRQLFLQCPAQGRKQGRAPRAAGEVEQESAKHKLKKVNHLENEKIKSARVQADQ
jgi:hypothetical protein